MPQWFVRGLRRGVVTTRYPARPDPSAALPADPAGVPARGADRQISLTGWCRSARAGHSPGSGDVLVFDVGACTACGRCRESRARGSDRERRVRAGRDRHVRPGEAHPAARRGGTAANHPEQGVTARKPSDPDRGGCRRALRRSVTRQFGRSLHIRTLDTGSCAACEQEIRLLAAPHYDLHRLGFFFTPAPRHADLLLVTGPMLRAFDIAARKTYEAMPGPQARGRNRSLRPRRGLPAGRVQLRARRRDAAGRRAGFPAARRARWPCCRACWSPWTGWRSKVPDLSFRQDGSAS